jgi:hypothetical protein
MPRLVLVLGLATAFSLGRAGDAPRIAPADFLARFQQLPGPRPEHEYLRRFEGEWEFVAEAKPPGAPAREMKGTYRSQLPATARG